MTSQERNWISVKDSLPPKGKDVLVRDCQGCIAIRYIPEPMDETKKKLRRIFPESSVAGDDGRSWYPGGLSISKTTHWMPIPKFNQKECN